MVWVAPDESARFAEATPILPLPAGHAAFRDASLRATGGEHSKNRAIRVQGVAHCWGGAIAFGDAQAG